MSDEYRVVFSMWGASTEINLTEISGFTQEGGMGENVFAGRPCGLDGGTSTPYLVDGLSGGTSFNIDENSKIIIQLAEPKAVYSVKLAKLYGSTLTGPQDARLQYKAAGGEWVFLSALDVAPIGSVSATTNVQVFPKFRLRATQNNGSTHSTYKFFSYLYEFGLFSAVDAGGINLAFAPTVLETNTGNGAAAVDGDDGTYWRNNVAEFMSITIGDDSLRQAQSARILFKDFVPGEVSLERWDGTQFVGVATINPITNVPVIVNF